MTINSINSNVPTGTTKTVDQTQNAKLRQVCADFESVFLNYMLQAMRSTLPGDDVFGKSFQKDMYESMYFEKIAETVSGNKGLGIGEALYRQLSSYLPSTQIIDEAANSVDMNNSEE